MISDALELPLVDIMQVAMNVAMVTSIKAAVHYIR